MVSLRKMRWMIIKKKHVSSPPLTRAQVDQTFPDMSDEDKDLLVGLEPEEDMTLSDGTTVSI